MRCFTITLFAILAGCATQATVTPRQYLDEETAATVTIVADPWIFSGAQAGRTMPTVMDDRTVAVATTDTGSGFAAERRDLISIYALDVNRMGDHRQYLAVQQSLARQGRNATLELRTGERTLELQPVAQSPLELGIARAPVKAAARGAQWSYFEIDREKLAAIARTRDLHPTLVVDGERVVYEMWRDGSAELTELSAVLEK